MLSHTTTACSNWINSHSQFRTSVNSSRKSSFFTQTVYGGHLFWDDSNTRSTERNFGQFIFRKSLRLLAKMQLLLMFYFLLATSGDLCSSVGGRRDDAMRTYYEDYGFTNRIRHGSSKKWRHRRYFYRKTARDKDVHPQILERQRQMGKYFSKSRQISTFTKR